MAYTEWFSRALLTAVLAFPWLSLFLSLRAMLRFHAVPAGPESLLMGSRAELWLVGHCSLPMPPFRGTLKLYNGFTGEILRYNDDKGIPTSHCGSYTVTVKRGRVYDYLGLFSLPIYSSKAKTLCILPKPIPVMDLPHLPQISSPSRDFAPDDLGENHELRPYRPGDRMNLIHRKLSAKTGQLILREPTTALQHAAVLTLTLRGTPSELDRKLGRFVWLGNHLLHHGIAFELSALTGNGIQLFPIQNPQDLKRTLDTLLVSPLAPAGLLPEHPCSGCWHYSIGGAPDEEA